MYTCIRIYTYIYKVPAFSMHVMTHCEVKYNQQPSTPALASNRNPPDPCCILMCVS